MRTSSLAVEPRRLTSLRECADCHTDYADDDTGLRWCLECREHHFLRCITCRTRFPCDELATPVCPCCREQAALF